MIHHTKWTTFLAIPVCAAGLLIGASVSYAGDAPARARSGIDDQKSISLTVYNSNLGLVRDVRNLAMPRGTVNLWFQDVAAKIDPTSVSIRTIGHESSLRVLEQNFEYDLISPARLMQKYVGHELELVRYPNGKEQRVRAKLLGTNGGYVYEIGGKIAINPWGNVELPSLPSGLHARPSLVWLLENNRARQTVEASYLTGGINWKANYVAVLDRNDHKVDLTGWVTIDNRSGTTYRNAVLKLVAGDVNRVKPGRGVVVDEAMAMPKRPSERQFSEQKLFEYHLYKLDRPATVRDNQTKQISLLEAPDVGVKKQFVYDPQQRVYFAARTAVDRNTKVGVYLTLDNSRKNHLGMPLPKGTVRVYKEDRDGALQFIGEDEIDHTPRDEKIRVHMGNAFDITAERVQTKFETVSSGHVYRSSYRVTIRNHKDEGVTVKVFEHPTGDWRVTRSSHDAIRESVSSLRFDVPVAANASADLTYTLEIRI